MPKKKPAGSGWAYALSEARRQDSDDEEGSEEEGSEEEEEDEDEEDEEGGEQPGAGQAQYAQGRVRAYHCRADSHSVKLKVTVPTTQRACEDLRTALRKDFIEVTLTKGNSASDVCRLLYDACRRAKPKSLPESTRMYLVATREKHAKRTIGLGENADIMLLREWLFLTTDT